MVSSAFQAIYFSLQRLVPRVVGNEFNPHTKGINIEAYITRMEFQLRLAEICMAMGFKLGLILGDSNAEGLNTRKKLAKFKSIVINMGRSGSTTGDWLHFFLETERGKAFYARLQALMDKGAVFIWNIGGNAALRDQMRGEKTRMARLHKMFPGSWNFLIPPVRIDWFEAIGINGKVMNERLQTLNRYIRDEWKDHAIDVYTPFVRWYEDHRETYIIVLADAVHFTDAADYKVRIPLMRAVVD